MATGTLDPASERGSHAMATGTCFLDDATHAQLVSEMGKRSFADDATVIRHFAYFVRSGKRFSSDDLLTILGEAGLNTDGVPTALEDLAGRRVLESYSRDGTMVYYMERGARIEYGESIGRKSRVSRWSVSDSTPEIS
jgi:hypothetical protein